MTICIAAANGVEFRGLLTGLPRDYTATLEDQTTFKFMFKKAGPGPNPPLPSSEFICSMPTLFVNSEKLMQPSCFSNNYGNDIFNFGKYTANM